MTRPNPPLEPPQWPTEQARVVVSTVEGQETYRGHVAAYLPPQGARVRVIPDGTEPGFAGLVEPLELVRLEDELPPDALDALAAAQGMTAERARAAAQALRDAGFDVARRGPRAARPLGPGR